jgi:hypothetical protein
MKYINLQKYFEKLKIFDNQLTKYKFLILVKNNKSRTNKFVLFLKKETISNKQRWSW